MAGSCEVRLHICEQGATLTAPPLAPASKHGLQLLPPLTEAPQAGAPNRPSHRNASV